ncbi:tyrosine-type recombinase/integrase [Roseivirga pacifica]|uniref:tyrosine-type recombinase/integrase n=1 Tax=Roseivirga pacifica TaxID=1267423 RepID=UPI0020943089|nr:tyrosine-type recombinase/integrase [Roseivirga pacifica]MCO6358179.1 tyrosine-type recombinase/integrase [Roseivirga pacifica]MCO6366617.1 tyrosine-type recombinase/integrase [Roseivirga pacifica]MCO6371102.1 tyrosine-type recombinase/integrase [Roseivirga pacifica]MCO6373910.1 tyrosine-type recombinase/integrase [Roseivirga pacifica]MCO6380891.1 tyrosine-type recombinase/integrase [Roseivirga pacifica]
MASFSFRLNRPKDSNGNLKKTEVLIQLRCTIDRVNRFDLSTGLKVVPKYWNSEKKSFRSTFQGSPEKNAQLNKLKAEVEIAYMEHRNLPVGEIKQKLLSVIHPVEVVRGGVPYLSNAIEQFMEDSQGVLNDSYLRCFIQVPNFIYGREGRHSPIDASVRRQRDVLLTKVGSDYLKKYIKWMVDAGYQNASINKHLKFIKKVLSSNSHLFDLDLTYRQVGNVKAPRKKPFWLSHDEIKLLINHKFDDKRHQQIADEWLFRYYTGLRDQDSHQLRKHHIKKLNGVYYFDFSMIKNGRDFLLPLSGAAMKVLFKYKYDLPKYTNQDKNEYIKKCFRIVGLKATVEKVTWNGATRNSELYEKWKLVTTHTARRSFGRKWMDEHGDIESLSQYLGQSSSTVTRNYIGWEMEEFSDYVKALDFS